MATITATAVANTLPTVATGAIACTVTNNAGTASITKPVFHDPSTGMDEPVATLTGTTSAVTGSGTITNTTLTMPDYSFYPETFRYTFTLPHLGSGAYTLTNITLPNNVQVIAAAIKLSAKANLDSGTIALSWLAKSGAFVAAYTPDATDAEWEGLTIIGKYAALTTGDSVVITLSKPMVTALIDVTLSLTVVTLQ
jgi:hypothetical protein